MHRIRTGVLHLLITGCFLYCSAAGISAADLPDKIILNSMPDYPPYVVTMDHGGLEGISIDVLTCVSQRLNIPFYYHTYPWARAQRRVRNGHEDGFFPASRNHERDQYATLSDKVSAQTWAWYLPVDSSLDPTTDSFRKTAGIGTKLGSNMFTWLKQQNYQIAFHSTEWKRLLEALLAGRVNAILATDATTDLLLKKLQLSDKIRKVPCQVRPLCVYFSNQFLTRYPGFLDLFNQQLPFCQKTPSQQ